MVKRKPEKWILSAKDVERLEKLREDSSNRRWKMRELLRKHNLLNKVFNYEDKDSCPLCGKRFVNDDLVDFNFGKPIHLRCLEKLKTFKRNT